MTKHTAGEWRIGDAGHTIFGPKVPEGLPRTIATVARLDDEGRANIELMRAAPQLLASLKELKELLKQESEYSISRSDGQPMGLGDVMPIGEIFLRADAAIAKAEGKL